MNTKPVLIAEHRESEPREVEGEIIGAENLIRFKGRIYHHTHEQDGRWVYVAMETK